MAKTTKAPRAGFIPYYIEDDVVYIMLMKPSDSKYGGSEFQIAKGHIDPGEDNITAALREAKEELGLLPRNLKDVQFLGKYLGYTDFFFGEIIDKSDFTSTTFETAATAWMTLKEFMVKGRNIHRHVIKDMANRLKVREQA